MGRKSKSRRSRRAKNSTELRPEQQPNAPVDVQESQPDIPKDFGAGAKLAVLILGIVFVWAYLPTLMKLVAAWESQPDYSHGYLVIPFAAYLLWARRESYPGVSPNLGLAGLVLVVASLALRLVGARIYIDAIDAWSMVFWIGGCVWFLGGRRLARWAAPAIAFLFFMIPLPWRLENALSHPLQKVATVASTWTLQLLGQPALSEGNTILLGEHSLEVEQACSGLRIFVGIVALAFAYVVLIRRRWWIRLFILLSVAPVALVANATRIVVTGLLYQYSTGELAKRFSHDFAGWAMIPFAAGLFALVAWYFRVLVREFDGVSVAKSVERSGIN